MQEDSISSETAAPVPDVSGDKTEFRSALEHTINCHSMENGSNTPDFILAQYLADCLVAYDRAVMHREAWYGRAESRMPGGDAAIC